MISAVSFQVAKDPVPTARPRVTRGGNTYTPKPSRDAQAEVLKAWEEAVAPVRWELEPERAYALHVVFARANYRRADADNLLKTVMDALTGHAWNDDSQVLKGTWQIEFWPRLNGEPGLTAVTVRKLPLDRKGNPLPLTP